MDLKIKNKIALVTGSTAGIGYAIAEALAREGGLFRKKTSHQDAVPKGTGSSAPIHRMDWRTESTELPKYRC